MTKLSEESIEFAKSHIKNFYDSDFFPKPFEFNAIWHNWQEVKGYILGRDIDNIPLQLPRVFCARKPNGSFRVVHQLDPVASIVYTSIAFLIAESVEQARMPEEEKKVCSYRIRIDKEKGSFFRDGTGYKDYEEKIHQLCKRYKYVLATDITDFYNQIYIHRLRNAVYNLGGQNEVLSVSLENFLLDINGSSSQGIPVGPAASIIMAEATMIDVDEFLISKDFDHVRYVDDIKIFSDSYEGLLHVLNDLTIYLHQNHRLSVSGEKTKFFETKNFLEKVFDTPEQEEKEGIHKTLEQIRLPRDAYDIHIDEDPPPEEGRPYILQAMFRKMLHQEGLDLGVARHILRRSRRYRIRSISNLVIENLDFLCPVISDLVLYLDSVTNVRFVNENIHNFESFVRHSPAACLPFIRFWMSEYFHRNPKFFRNYEIARYVRESNNYESVANLAIDTKDIAWFRENKYRVSELNSWERRALYKTALGFSRDECIAWINAIERRVGDDIIEKSVISWVKAKSGS